MSNFGSSLGMMNASPVAAMGGFQGVMIPGFGFTIIGPSPLFDSSRWLRIHRKILKDVVKTVLFEWHAKILPEHFKPSNKTKYNHKPRQDSTRRRKRARYGHDVDLHRTGKTKRSMSSRIPTVRLSGTGDQFLVGRMQYRFPFPISRDTKDPRYVTMSQMAREIGTWTQQEQVWAIGRIAKLYAEETMHYLKKSPRLMRRYQQSLSVSN